jgi:hypothetical protein
LFVGLNTRAMNFIGGNSRAFLFLEERPQSGGHDFSRAEPILSSVGFSP